MKNCTDCGNTEDLTSKFCSACGSELPTEKLCVSCGTKRSASAKFCAECGSGFEVAKTEPVSNLSLSDEELNIFFKDQVIDLLKSKQSIYIENVIAISEHMDRRWPAAFLATGVEKEGDSYSAWHPVCPVSVASSAVGQSLIRDPYAFVKDLKAALELVNENKNLDFENGRLTGFNNPAYNSAENCTNEHHRNSPYCTSVKHNKLSKAEGYDPEINFETHEQVLAIISANQAVYDEFEDIINGYMIAMWPNIFVSELLWSTGEYDVSWNTPDYITQVCDDKTITLDPIRMASELPSIEFVAQFVGADHEFYHLDDFAEFVPVINRVHNPELFVQHFKDAVERLTREGSLTIPFLAQPYFDHLAPHESEEAVLTSSVPPVLTRSELDKMLAMEEEEEKKMYMKQEGEKMEILLNISQAEPEDCLDGMKRAGLVFTVISSDVNLEDAFTETTVEVKNIEDFITKTETERDSIDALISIDDLDGNELWCQ